VYLKSWIKGQDSVPSIISCHSGSSELFQELGSTIRKETNRYVWDEMLLLRRDEFDVKLLHSFGILMVSACQLDLTQIFGVHEEKDGSISYETKIEYLLDDMVGNVHSRVDQGVEDNVSKKKLYSWD
jgi:hypothetical protein